MSTVSRLELPDCQTLKLVEADGVLRVMLSRPEVRNAMSLTMVRELTDVFEAVAEDNLVRVVLITGEGSHFCAGADISDMAKARSQSGSKQSTAEDTNDTSPAVTMPEGNLRQTKAQDISADPFAALNRAFGTMLLAIDQSPCTVITCVQGAALGGGFGLVCVSDHAIAGPSASFALPETGLGILPAQIAPFVVRRIGLTQARSLALLGRRIDANTAFGLGLVHETADSAENFESACERAVVDALRCAPAASRATKALLRRVDPEPAEALADILDDAALQFSRTVKGSEGQEGTMAFMQKRPPSWVSSPNKSDD